MKDFSFKIENRLTPRNKFVIDYCGRVKGMRVLDVGCSFGWLEKALLAKGAKEIIGIEPEERLFYNAKKEVSGARFMVGSALKIPFPDNFFDQVIFLEVLEHLPKKSEKKAISEIARVMKKDGTLIMSVPNRNLASCLLDQAWFLGHRHYSLNFVKKLLEENSFKVQSVSFYGRFWELFRMTSHYFFKWVFQKEDPFKNFFDEKIKNDGKRKDGYAYIYLKANKNG